MFLRIMYGFLLSCQLVVLYFAKTMIDVLKIGICIIALIGFWILSELIGINDKAK